VQIVNRLHYLIENELSVFFSQNVLAYECIQVNVHVLEDQINIFVIFCLYYFFKFYYVGMTQFHQKHDFTVSPLCVCRIVKCIKVLFQSFYFSGTFVSDFPDVTVGSAPYFLMNLKPSEDVTL